MVQSWCRGSFVPFDGSAMMWDGEGQLDNGDSELYKDTGSDEGVDNGMVTG